MFFRPAAGAEHGPLRVSWADDVKFLQAGNALSKADWQALLQQGIQAVQAGQGPIALAALQQASQLQPDSRDVRHWLGQAQRLCGRAEAAERNFHSLLEANPLDS